MFSRLIKFIKSLGNLDATSSAVKLITERSCMRSDTSYSIAAASAGVSASNPPDTFSYGSSSTWNYSSICSSSSSHCDVISCSTDAAASPTCQ